jgi:DNA-binding NarL/FixJ family response regulator
VAAAGTATTKILDADAAVVATADARRADAQTAASVTPAEQCDLRYLPTKLTFAFIADKLGISRGAAKSRAQRAHRTLGVHNLADAVRRARSFAPTLAGPNSA